MTGQAAPETIIKHARALSRMATPNDSLLLFSAGHGAPMRVDDREDVYLISNTFEPDEVQFDPVAQPSLRWLRKTFFTRGRA